MVLTLLRGMAGRELSMLVITHNLEHLWAIVDRIVVLRRGRRSRTCARMKQVAKKSSLTSLARRAAISPTKNG